MEQSKNTLSDLSPEQIAKIIEGANAGLDMATMLNVSDETIEGLYSLAYNLYTSGNFVDAMPVFQVLCIYKTRQPRYWMGLAGCRQATGDLNGAAEAYGMAGLMGGLKDPEPFLFAARCFLKMGDRQKAMDTCYTILEIGNPNETQVARIHASARSILNLLEGTKGENV